MKDKLVIHSAKPLTPKNGNTIRAVISDETLDELHKLSDHTGHSLQQLARWMIEFAIQHVEVKD